MKLASINDSVHAPPGNHRAPCPYCDRGTTDDALGVTVEPGRHYIWHCFRCGWAGASGVTSSNPQPRVQAAPNAHHDGLSKWATALWQSTRTLEGDALAYLQARSCVCPPIYGDLRCHPALKHAPSGYIGPALVALVTDALTGTPMSLHRTWIRSDGKKADVKPARMLAANHRAKGGVIRLWPDECISFGLAVAEGIETALSVAHAIVPAWACIDAGNLSRLAVLNGVNSLVIAADGDEVGRMAAKECAARWRRSRKPVAVMDPGDGRDWNDEVAA